MSRADRAKSPITKGDFLLVDVDRFQGPMDLLLHLIRRQDIDIFDIPISTITDQFLAAVQEIGVEDLDGAGEFLEMAATLIRIKAQMLLPRPGDEEEEDPRAELVRRLLEYEQIREIASRLSRSEAARGRRFGKGYVEPRPLRYWDDTPLETTWDEVMEAAMRVETPHPLTRAHRVTTGLVALEEKIELILASLKDMAEGGVQGAARTLEGEDARGHDPPGRVGAVQAAGRDAAAGHALLRALGPAKGPGSLEGDDARRP